MKRILLIILLLGFLIPCLSAEGNTEIAEIEAQPRDYVGRTVTISGEITQIKNIPLTDYIIQTVYDRTAMMNILTKQPRQVGDSFNGLISIAGFNSQEIEKSTDDLSESLAQMLLSEDLVTEDEAYRIARKVSRGLAFVLQALDVSLLGIEVSDQAVKKATGSTI